MYLNIKTYSTSNYGCNTYDVIGVVDGTTLGEFIEELNKYHKGTHLHSSIRCVDLTGRWPALFEIDIPARKDIDVNSIDKSIIDLPICCHMAIGSWGANTYYVYPYGKHTKIPDCPYKTS